MAQFPPAIIFVNNDLTGQIQEYLTKQLFIDLVLTGDQFDYLVSNDSNYAQNVKIQNKRIMVIRLFSAPYNNRELADVVLFVKEGMASILKNNFGPPGNTYKVLDLYWGKLGIF